MKNFIYDIPVKIYFGEKQLGYLGEELGKHGKKVLLVYGGGSIKHNGLYEKIVKEVQKAGLEMCEVSGIDPNPRIGSVREGVSMCKEEGVDVVLAVGGGSVLDAGKWIAAGACVDFDPWDFFGKWEVVEKALPVVTVLTLAATGSEMDAGGVISNPDTKDKIGRMDQALLPKASFLDPTLTYSVDRYQTACGAADMISHILEVYFNMEKDLEMLDFFMEGLLKTIIKYAPIAMKKPDNYEARANLMWASSWAINGFINGGRQQAWSCHPMEHELSAIYDITHGLGLAILTPRWLTYCLDEKTAPRYARFAKEVFGIDKGIPMETAKGGIEALSKFLFKKLGLADNFTKIGISKDDFPIMAKKACGGNVLNGFKHLKQEDIEKIYEMCL